MLPAPDGAGHKIVKWHLAKLRPDKLIVAKFLSRRINLLEGRAFVGKLLVQLLDRLEAGLHYRLGEGAPAATSSRIAVGLLMSYFAVDHWLALAEATSKATL